MRFIRSPLCSVYVTLSIIVILEFVPTAHTMNMWTGVEKRAAPPRERPLKRCLSPCKIFHSWCKNDGKCREKGEDCTWYCECPDNCEGFFCEKIVPKEITAPIVEVKITVQKEEKKDASSFDKSKLAQALAGIMMKKQTREEDKAPALPNTIDRVGTGDKISVKENLTTTIILNCSIDYNGTEVNVSSSENTTNVLSNSSLPLSPALTSDNNNQSDIVADSSNMSNITVNDPPQNVSVTDSVETTNVSNTEYNNPNLINSVKATSDSREAAQLETQTVTESMQITSTGTTVSTTVSSDTLGQKRKINSQQSEMSSRKTLIDSAKETNSSTSALESLIERAFESIPVERVKTNTVLQHQTKNNQTSTIENVLKSTPKSGASTTTTATTVKSASTSLNTTPIPGKTTVTINSSLDTLARPNEAHNFKSVNNKQTSSTTGGPSVKGISISDKQEKSSDGNELYSARSAINLTSGANLSHEEMHVILKTSTDSPSSTAAGNIKPSNQTANGASTLSPTTKVSPTAALTTKKMKTDTKTNNKGNALDNKKIVQKQSKYSVKTVTSEVEPKLKPKRKESRVNAQFASTTPESTTITEANTESPQVITSSQTAAKISTESHTTYAPADQIVNNDEFSVSTPTNVQENAYATSTPNSLSTLSNTSQDGKSMSTIMPSKPVSDSLGVSPKQAKLATKGTSRLKPPHKPSTYSTTTIRSKTKTTTKRQPPTSKSTTTTTTTTLPTTTQMKSSLRPTSTQSTTTKKVTVQSTTTSTTTSKGTTAPNTPTSSKTFVTTESMVTSSESSTTTDSSLTTSVSMEMRSEKGSLQLSVSQTDIASKSSQNLTKDSTVIENKLVTNDKQSGLGSARPIVKGANASIGDSKSVKDISAMTQASDKSPETGKDVALNEPDLLERNVAVGQGLNNAL